MTGHSTAWRRTRAQAVSGAPQLAFVGTPASQAPLPGRGQGAAEFPLRLLVTLTTPCPQKGGAGNVQISVKLRLLRISKGAYNLIYKKKALCALTTTEQNRGVSLSFCRNLNRFVKASRTKGLPGTARRGREGVYLHQVQGRPLAGPGVPRNPCRASTAAHRNTSVAVFQMMVWARKFREVAALSLINQKANWRHRLVIKRPTFPRNAPPVCPHRALHARLGPSRKARPRRRSSLPPPCRSVAMLEAALVPRKLSRLN